MKHNHWKYDVARMIFVARVRAGLTQTKLAKMAGVHQESLSRAESALHIPSLPYLEKISKALGLKLVAPRFVKGEITKQ